LLEKFLDAVPGSTPFLKLVGLSWRKREFMQRLQDSRLGQYNRLYNFMKDSLELPDLKTVSLWRLMQVRGCGPKTARMFLMFTRPNQRYAALDTHVLKHLKANGHKVPKATPSSGRRYDELEQIFLKMADDAKMSVADYDLMIWKRYAT
jgi:thermostable 8-oxoguanine DNA glycosylase